MYRPYIICHMVMSIDGKVTGDFLSRPESAKDMLLVENIDDRAFLKTLFTAIYPNLPMPRSKNSRKR